MVRIGLLHKTGSSDMGRSIPEQLLGADLAAAYTREQWGGSGPTLELILRPVSDDPETVDQAATALVDESGCQALMGMLTVPLSIRAAQWAQAHDILYMAANNNRRVWDGRSHVFHIGVPSEMTGRAGARFWHEEQGAHRAYILHTGGEFQVYAAGCTASAMRDRGMAVESEPIDEEDASGDAALLQRVRDWNPDALCVLASELERVATLVREAHKLGGLPPMLLARGMLCREFAEATGAAGEGQFFTDLYLRDADAPEEELALRASLAGVDPTLVATANHGFGWDGLRLLADALRVSEQPQEQISYLEGTPDRWGATGAFTFRPDNRSGRVAYDPTTITTLRGGAFEVVSRMNR